MFLLKVVIHLRIIKYNHFIVINFQEETKHDIENPYKDSNMYIKLNESIQENRE